MQTQFIGTYNLDNTLVTITIGSHFGVSDEQINHALAGYVPNNDRSQLQITARNRLVTGAYSVNPTSMEAALTNLQRMDVPKKVAILDDTRKLGDVGMAEHQKIVDLIATLNLDKVWLVDEKFDRIDTTLRRFKDTEAVRGALRQRPPQDHYILIKDDNGTRLFQLPELS